MSVKPRNWVVLYVNGERDYVTEASRPRAQSRGGEGAQNNDRGQAQNRGHVNLMNQSKPHLISQMLTVLNFIRQRVRML